MTNPPTMFNRHDLDIWRDEQVLQAATVLNETAMDLTESFEPLIAASGWTDQIIDSTGFLRNK